MSRARASTSRAQATGSEVLQQGIVLHRRGELDAAEYRYRAVKRRDPAYGEALRMRGVLAHQRGQGERAIALMGKAVEQQPSNPVFHHGLAEMLRAHERPEAAVASYRRAYALDGRPDTGLDLADTLASMGRTNDALRVCGDLVAAVPAYASAHERIVTLRYEGGDLAGAQAALSEWRACADTRAGCQRLAATAGRVAAYDTAESIYRELLARDPADARSCAGLGSVLQSRGRFDAAQEWFERALEHDPGLGWVYAALAANRDYVISGEREATMRARVAHARTPAADREHLHFALGRLYDTRAEHEQAFAHYAAGNRLHAAAEPFDAAVFDDRIERIIRLFTPEFFAARRGLGLTKAKPVFVVGMPRSGTSLVEQIVASHPAIHGAGELDDIRRIVRELPARLGTRKRFPECTRMLTQDHAQALAQRYLAALEQRAPTAARITDKMPFNLLWLGLVALLLPEARVIYCRRDAMDNCLSCYFQSFSKGMRFTYDLGHLGRVYRQHERLMAHWAACLPLNMITVDYEALVADQNTQSRRLIEFLGVDWDDGVIDFHRTDRPVRTASVWQVRQPVYRSSVERWRAYEPWLDELRAALAGQ